ncbi:UPF0481 protein [Gossypium australe]|uniref:UPF0481 protein n=1 Tax=Gossypium australe TaxID=47621 RepID=A0A5B6WLA1_9ROSI|nr:UPF0481 protein [Gossypium australe]
MLAVQPNAYAPTIISIGPYHLGHERLQAMEELKWKFFHCLFRPNQPNGVELDPAMKAMEDLEQDARRCYWDNAEQHSKHRFVRMMPVNGCFIVELLRELKHNFQCAPFVKRWMLPTLRWDLIMLENQLPLFVLQKLFELTKGSEESSTCLEQLALCFFNPLLQSQRDVRAVNAQGIQNTLLFLDLFRKSILLLPINLSRGLKTSKTSDSSNAAEEGIDMMWSMNLIYAKVVHDMNTCCNGSYAWFRARLVHHYFWVAGISTLGATIVVYFSLIQTGFVFVEDPKNLNKPFYYDLIRCVILPLDHLFFSKIYNEYKNKIYMYSI